MTGTRISDMAHLASLPASGARFPVIKDGDTANYSYDLATDLAGKIRHVADRAALALLDHAIGLTAYLRESGRERTFVFSTANNAANVTADPQQGIYVAPSSDPTGASGAWVRKYVGPWKPEWFGAAGDGATNDHAAFHGMSVLGKALGKLHIELRGSDAIYRVGKQNLNGLDSEGLGPYYYANENPIEALGLKALIIKGNGATLKFNDGLLYGAFDTATGLPHNDAVNTISHNGEPGFIVYARGNDLVDISNVNFDGNSATFILGGTNGGFFDCRHTGAQIDSFFRASMKNCSFKNFIQDGWHTRQTKWGLTENDDPRPIVIENCVSTNCGRACGAVLGGNSVLVKNCAFLRPGSAPALGGGVANTSPVVAMDIECESTNPTKHVRYENCVFEQGPNGTRALSSGATPYGVTYNDCTFIGSILSTAPRSRFNYCKIYGYFWRLLGNQASVADNTIFENCFLTDATKHDTPLQVASGNSFIGTSSPQVTGVRFVSCEFDLSRIALNLIDVTTRDCKVTLRHDTTQIASAGTVMSINGVGDHRNMNVLDAIAANFPANQYVIATATTAKYRECNLTSATPNIRFTSTTSTSGFTGELDNYVGRRGTDALTNANAAPTIPKGKNVQQLDVAISAARTLTLPAPTAGVTRRYRIVRTANSTGAFNYNINTSSAVLLKALTAASQWAEVESDNGAEYALIASGTL